MWSQSVILSYSEGMSYYAFNLLGKKMPEKLDPHVQLPVDNFLVGKLLRVLELLLKSKLHDLTLLLCSSPSGFVNQRQGRKVNSESSLCH